MLLGVLSVLHLQLGLKTLAGFFFKLVRILREMSAEPAKGALLQGEYGMSELLLKAR